MVWVALSYLLVALTITWPVAIHLQETVFATPGDPFGTLATLAQYRTSWPELTFPAAPVLVLTATLLARLFGDVASYNLIIIASFTLTGFAGYLIVFQLTRHRVAALWAGFVLTFAPFHVSHTLQHLGLANVQWFLLFVWLLLRFDERPTVRRGGLVGLMFAVTTLDSYQYGLTALVTLITFGLWRCCRYLMMIDRRIGSWQAYRAVAVSVAVALVIILPAILPLTHHTDRPTTTRSLIPTRSYAELRVYSAQWFAYVLPSPDNPLFGRFTRQRYRKSVAATGSNVTELNLYVGWVTLALGFVGLATSWSGSLTRRWVTFVVLLGLIGLWTSFAPTLTIGSISLPAPAEFIFQLAPTVRVYSRFGLLVLTSVTILGGFGLAWLLHRYRARRWQVVVIGGVVILSSLLELWALPPGRTVAVDAAHLPAAYRLLPPGRETVLAEYPLWGDDEPAGYRYLLWQRIHGAHLLYQQLGSAERTVERTALLNPTDEVVVTALKARGVTHVMIHRASYTLEQVQRHPTEFGSATAPTITDPRLVLIGRFLDGTDVYRVD